jgi:membrane associated rhomboid family serine protease
MQKTHMKHYFRVYPTSQESPRRKKSFIGAWLSGLSVTSWLIFLNIAVFFIVLVLLFFLEPSFLDYLALKPSDVFEKGYFWTVFTSMFVHIMPFHLFVNMFSLFFLGKFLETIIGRKRFFWLYIFSGIFAGVFFAVLAYFFGGISPLIGRIFSTPMTPAVGASGAIFAIAGVLALLTPRNRVYLIAGPLIAIIVQAGASIFIKSEPALNILSTLITIYIFAAVIAMFSFNSGLRRISIPIEMPFWMVPIAAIVPLVIIGLFVELPIGNMAHLGGFIAGALYGVYLRAKYKRKTRAIAEYFSR